MTASSYLSLKKEITPATNDTPIVIGAQHGLRTRFGKTKMPPIIPSDDRDRIAHRKAAA
jgi:hypothetical protein